MSAITSATGAAPRMQTGARCGQLAQLVVSDFNPNVGTVRTRTRKGDGHEKEYHVTLTEEGATFFKEVCAGRPGRNQKLQNTVLWRADTDTWQGQIRETRALMLRPVTGRGLRRRCMLLRWP